MAGVLLYVGAGWDCDIVHDATHISEFIFVDGLTRLEHYKHPEYGYDYREETFVQNICDSMPLHTVEREDDLLTFNLRDGRVVLYYIYMPIQKFLKRHADVLARCTLFLTRGFDISASGVQLVDQMPLFGGEVYGPFKAGATLSECLDMLDDEAEIDSEFYHGPKEWVVLDLRKEPILLSYRYKTLIPFLPE